MPTPPADRNGSPTIRLDRQGGGAYRPRPRGVSGRRFVVAGVLGLLALWGGLSFAFRSWKSGVEERIAFGKANVAPAVRPLAGLEPPGIVAEDWGHAVGATEAMLAEVVGTGRLDRPAMEALRSDLLDRVDLARSRPGRARAILAQVWDDMERLKRLRQGTARPDLLRDRPAPAAPPTEEGRP